MKMVMADTIVIIGLSRTNNLKEIKKAVYTIENNSDFAKTIFLDLFELKKLNNPLAKYLNISTNTRDKNWPLP